MLRVNCHKITMTPRTAAISAPMSFDLFIGHAILWDSTTLNNVYQDYDNGKHQQDMNEPSYGVTAHQSKQPQDKQNNSNGPQHGILLFSKWFPLSNKGLGGYDFL